MEFISTSSEAYPRYTTLWTKLALSTGQADPFCCTPVWQLSFHDAFSPKRRLLFQEASGNMIAFAKWISPKGKCFLTPIEPHWFFGCPLLGEQAVELLSDAIPFLEKTCAFDFPEIIISGIRPESRLLHRLIQAFGNRFDLRHHSSGIQCAASLEGGFDGFLSRRTAKERKNLRRESRLASEAGISFERVMPASPEEAKTTYDRMLTVELASWKGIGQCGMAEPGVREFYDIMLQRLSLTKTGRVIFARHEDKDIGFIFGGMAGDIYRGQQFSYDDAWRSLSIGNLMQTEQIRWLSETGGKRYDMGPLKGPRMEYKVHWTEEEIRIQTWILRKKTR